MITVELVQAWPGRVDRRLLTLREGATVGDALQEAGLDGPVAVFGERAATSRVLEDGDRVELLRPLLADPKDARRRRAARGAG